MARDIVGGRGRLLRDYYREQRDEAARWGRQRRKGEKAREIEAERGNLWSTFTTALAFFTPGSPTQFNISGSMAIGSGVGNFFKGIGTWGGERIEDIGFLSEEVGKFEKGQVEDVRDYNRALSAYDKEEFWRGITDVGKSALYAYASPEVQSFLGERAAAKSAATVPLDVEGTFDVGQEFGETFGATSEESLGFSMPGEEWGSAPQAPGYTPSYDLEDFSPRSSYVPDYPQGVFPSDVEVDYLQPSYSFPEPEAFGIPGSGGMWEWFFNRPDPRRVY
jgi:hypothetical protein